MGDGQYGNHSAELAAKWTWTVLLVVVVGGGLAILTGVFGWWNAAAMCLLGVVAGLLTSYALLKAAGHEHAAFYAALGFGLLVIPAFAVYLSAVAARDTGAFLKWNASFTPFGTFALATVAARMTLAVIWRPSAAGSKQAVEQPEEFDEWRVRQVEAEAERQRQLASEANLVEKAG